MRRLLLASTDVGQFDVLAGMTAVSYSKRVVIVANAKDLRDHATRAAKVESTLSALAGSGLTGVELDLRTAAPNDMSKMLHDAAAIWFCGGNTFLLMHEVYRSGLYGLLGWFLDHGLIYGGESAGAAMAGTTLDGVVGMDDARVAPSYAQALGLVGFVVVPHDGNDTYARPQRIAGTSLHLADGTAAMIDDQLHIVTL